MTVLWLSVYVVTVCTMSVCPWDTKKNQNLSLRKLNLYNFKSLLIPVVSCDAGIDVIWRGCEGTGAGDIVTHVLSKDYTMSDQSGRGRAGIILVFGSNYTHVIPGDTGRIIKFGHNLYTRAFQIGGIKYFYCCSKLVNKCGFCFQQILKILEIHTIRQSFLC